MQDKASAATCADSPRRAWAVQILLVALSLRMCCSLVCIAILRAGLPLESMDTPMIRPGILRELEGGRDRERGERNRDEGVGGREGHREGEGEGRKEGREEQGGKGRKEGRKDTLVFVKKD